VAQWSKPSSDPVCGPVQYIITVSTGGIVISNVTINRTNYTATGLSENTDYRINVTAINKAGNGNVTSKDITTENGGKCTFCVDNIPSACDCQDVTVDCTNVYAIQLDRMALVLCNK